MSSKKIVTYIHKWQKGKYLEFAGFKKIKRLAIQKTQKVGVIDLIDQTPILDLK